ncbi:hypothetical protein fugu_017986 [Takifugu bimaculatus]|uniref:Ig-like domain-containing protein n=1 Tax=Takifugu bimaculatus TaxID=433685 RepID=A0A4Z2BTS6_9TELE|nr:hypothetical protein fugu_017986 [Takifugu bimaculatus]
MVVQVRWIKGLFHLMLLLRAAAETTQLVREGDKAMLTCGNLKENPAKCGVTAQVKADYVELTCCVFTYKTCSHKVTWFFNEVQMKKGTGLVLTSQNSCSATANVMTRHEYWKRNTLLTCQVQYDQVVKTFPLRAPGVASAETTTTVSTRTADDSAPLRAVEKNCNDGRNTHSAVTHSSPEISQDKRDAEDPVSYATIIFRSPPRAQGQRKNSDGGKVIYTTLKSVPSDPSI